MFLADIPYFSNHGGNCRLIMERLIRRIAAEQ